MSKSPEGEYQPSEEEIQEAEGLMSKKETAASIEQERRADDFESGRFPMHILGLGKVQMEIPQDKPRSHDRSAKKYKPMVSAGQRDKVIPRGYNFVPASSIVMAGSSTEEVFRPLEKNDVEKIKETLEAAYQERLKLKEQIKEAKKEEKKINRVNRIKEKKEKEEEIPLEKRTMFGTGLWKTVGLESKLVELSRQIDETEYFLYFLNKQEKNINKD